jgi:hypothetical protein
MANQLRIHPQHGSKVRELSTVVRSRKKGDQFALEGELIALLNYLM